MNLFLNSASTPPAVQLKSTGAPLASMRLKRGAEVPLVVTLLGVQDASNLRLGLKAAHEGDILALASAETGTPCEAGISFTLSLVVRSDALDAALHVGEATSLAKLNAMAEFVWEEDGQTRISDTVTVALLNDIVRSSTTTPGDGTEVYPSVEALATKAWVRELRASAAAAGLVLLESDAVLEGEHTAVALTSAGAIAVPKATRSVDGTVLLGTDNVLNGLNVLPVGRDADGRLAVDASGMSAYDLAVKAGYVGTAEDWLTSLKGEPGEAVAEERVEAMLTSRTEQDARTTPNGTDNITANYIDLVSAHVPTGTLHSIALRCGSSTASGMTTTPLYLAVWELQEGSATQYELVGVSTNTVTQAINTTGEWSFDGIEIHGRGLRLIATSDAASPDDKTAMLRLRCSPTSDGSQCVINNTPHNTIPKLTITATKRVYRFASFAHQEDSAIHLTAAEHALLSAALSENETYGRTLSTQTLQVGNSDGRLLVLSNSGVTLAALGDCRALGLQAPEDIHFVASTQYAAEVDSSTGAGTLIWWTTGSETSLSPYGVTQPGSGFGRPDRPTEIRGSTLSFNGLSVDPTALAELLSNKDALLALLDASPSNTTPDTSEL